MTLKQLVVEDEPELEINHIPLTSEDDKDTDPEMPNDFLVQDDLDLLSDSAAALETIGCRLACEGIDLSTARELEKVIPDFMRGSGGHGRYTIKPSIEGLADGIKAVKDKFFEIIKKLREKVTSAYKRFLEWLMAKFSKADAKDVMDEVNDFLSQTREKNAIEYISNLPDEPEEAAAEIARFMDGDTKAFTADLTDKFQIAVKRANLLYDSMEKNPTQYRLATGLVTVSDIFSKEADSEIHKVIDDAYDAADAAMKASNQERFMEAILKIEEISKQIDAIKEETIAAANDIGGVDDDKPVSYIKLYEYAAAAANDMKKVSIQQQVKGVQSAIKRTIEISESTNLEEVLEMIPEDVPAETHHKFASKIVAFYRSIAKLGAVFLQIWNARVAAVTSINKVGEALIGLKEGIEKAVVSAGSSLTSEQKTQLTKALVGKGLKIIF